MSPNPSNHEYTKETLVKLRVTGMSEGALHWFTRAWLQRHLDLSIGMTGVDATITVVNDFPLPNPSEVTSGFNSLPPTSRRDTFTADARVLIDSGPTVREFANAKDLTITSSPLPGGRVRYVIEFIKVACLVLFCLLLSSGCAALCQDKTSRCSGQQVQVCSGGKWRRFADCSQILKLEDGKVVKGNCRLRESTKRVGCLREDER